MNTDTMLNGTNTYRRIIEQLPYLVSVHGKEGLFEYISPAYNALLGHAADHLRNTSFYDYVHPADTERVRGAFKQVVLRGGTQNVQCRLRAHDQNYVWMNMAFAPGPDDSHILVYGRDASEVKYLEDALRILARGSDTLHGIEYFRVLVSQVAAALRVPFAFITEHYADKTRVRMLAFWKGDTFGNPFEYDLPGTPCDDVINKGKFCHFPRGVQAMFPQDRDLVALAAQGYIGVPLYDSKEQVIGHLALLDSKPLVVGDREVSILRIFAGRAGQELERWQAQANSEGKPATMS